MATEYSLTNKALEMVKREANRQTHLYMSELLEMIKSGAGLVDVTNMLQHICSELEKAEQELRFPPRNQNS